MKKSLLFSNPHLRNEETLMRRLRRNARTSCAIEGIQCLESKRIKAPVADPPHAALLLPMTKSVFN